MAPWHDFIYAFYSFYALGFIFRNRGHLLKVRCGADTFAALRRIQMCPWLHFHVGHYTRTELKPSLFQSGNNESGSTNRKPAPGMTSALKNDTSVAEKLAQIQVTMTKYSLLFVRLFCECEW